MNLNVTEGFLNFQSVLFPNNLNNCVSKWKATKIKIKESLVKNRLLTVFYNAYKPNSQLNILFANYITIIIFENHKELSVFNLSIFRKRSWKFINSNNFIVCFLYLIVQKIFWDWWEECSLLKKQYLTIDVRK